MTDTLLERLANKSLWCRCQGEEKTAELLDDSSELLIKLQADNDRLRKNGKILVAYNTKHFDSAVAHCARADLAEARVAELEKLVPQDRPNIDAELDQLFNQIRQLVITTTNARSEALQEVVCLLNDWSHMSSICSNIQLLDSVAEVVTTLITTGNKYE